MRFVLQLQKNALNLLSTYSLMTLFMQLTDTLWLA